MKSLNAHLNSLFDQVKYIVDNDFQDIDEDKIHYSLANIFKLITLDDKESWEMLKEITCHYLIWCSNYYDSIDKNDPFGEFFCDVIDDDLPYDKAYKNLIDRLDKAIILNELFYSINTIINTDMILKSNNNIYSFESSWSRTIDNKEVRLNIVRFEYDIETFKLMKIMKLLN